MFGIGFPELMVVLVVALIFIGPKRLPEVARSIGKGYRELQKGISGVKSEMEAATKDVKDETEPLAKNWKSNFREADAPEQDEKKSEPKI